MRLFGRVDWSRMQHAAMPQQLLPRRAVRQRHVACLELAAGLQFESWNACNSTQYSLSGVWKQVKNLNDVLGRLEAANFVDVVLGHEPPFMLERSTRILPVWPTVGGSTWSTSTASSARRLPRNSPASARR